MSDLRAIATLYEQVDNYFDDLREGCNKASVERDQKINDQAYFVLAWGQLEAGVNDACANAIRQGRLQTDWRDRRPWNRYDPENLRMRFKDRLRLVLEENSREWNLTINHYRVRNDIAHGTLCSHRINVSNVIEEFSRILSSLARD